MRLSRMQWRIRPGPLLGEHNDYVFREALGLPPEEIARLEAQGVFSPRVAESGE